MILRRLADAIRTQNWFTVVLEVAIVVVGIFIGLQVDDWNQRRVDKVREQAILASLAQQAGNFQTKSDAGLRYVQGRADALSVRARIRPANQ